MVRAPLLFSSRLTNSSAFDGTDNRYSMDAKNPTNRMSRQRLKMFLEYCRKASNFEEAIFNLRTDGTANKEPQMCHLDVVSIPHDGFSSAQCWNFLDIPMLSDGDLRMTLVLIHIYAAAQN